MLKLEEGIEEGRARQEEEVVHAAGQVRAEFGALYGYLSAKWHIPRLVNSPFPVVVASTAMLSFFNSVFEPTPVHTSARFLAQKNKLANIEADIALATSVTDNRLVRMQALEKHILDCKKDAQTLKQKFFADCLTRKLNKFVLASIKEDEEIAESVPSRTIDSMKVDMQIIYDLEVRVKKLKADYETLSDNQASGLHFLASLRAKHQEKVRNIICLEQYLRVGKY